MRIEDKVVRIAYAVIGSSPSRSCIRIMDSLRHLLGVLNHRCDRVLELCGSLKQFGNVVRIFGVIAFLFASHENAIAEAGDGG